MLVIPHEHIHLFENAYMAVCFGSLNYFLLNGFSVQKQLSCTSVVWQFLSKAGNIGVTRLKHVRNFLALPLCDFLLCVFRGGSLTGRTGRHQSARQALSEASEDVGSVWS